MGQRLVLTWCLVMLPAPVSATVQAAPGDTTHVSAIAGFRSLEWGADSARITRVVGTPDTIRSVPGMEARAMVYARDTLGGTTGSLGFLVDLREGLIRVLFLAPYGSDGSCLTLYQRLRDAVARNYPHIESRERLYNRARDLDFCTAFQLGRAGALTVWRDPRTDARFWVALDLDAGAVRVSFESPSYARRAERPQSPRR